MFRFPLCGLIHVEYSERTQRSTEKQAERGVQPDAEQLVVVAAAAADEKEWGKQRVSGARLAARAIRSFLKRPPRRAGSGGAWDVGEQSRETLDRIRQSRDGGKWEEEG